MNAPLRPVRLVLLLCVLLAGCTSVFLHPDRVHHLPQRAIGTPAETVAIATADGSELHALYLPAVGAPRAAVLFLHGNAENLSSHVHAVSWLPAQGYSVLAIDYRGFGDSPGQASVDAVHQDAAAGLAWLAAREAQLPLVIYGQSLGGSAALRLAGTTALRGRLAAVIADSAFASYRGIARDKLAQFWLTWPLQWPLSLLVSDRYAAQEVVARISPVPLLLIHGQSDGVVGPQHSQQLYERALPPKDLWLIPQGQHIDAVRREGVRARLLDYLGRVTGPASADAAPALEKSPADHIRRALVTDHQDYATP